MPKNRLLLDDCELAYPFLWWDSVLHLTLEHSLVAHTTPGALETWKRMAFLLTFCVTTDKSLRWVSVFSYVKWGCQLSSLQGLSWCSRKCNLPSPSPCLHQRGQIIHQRIATSCFKEEMMAESGVSRCWDLAASCYGRRPS